MSRACLGFIAAMAIMAGSARTLAEDEQFTLAHKFRAGEIVHYQISADGNGTSTQVGPGDATSQPLTFSRTALVRHKVAGVAPEGTATVAEQIETMTWDVKIGGHTIKNEFSAKGQRCLFDGKDRTARFKKLKYGDLPMFGKAVMTKMKPTGEITEIKGLPNEDVSGFGPDMPSFIMALGDLSLTLPEHAVAVGEAWEGQVLLPVPSADANRPLEAFTSYRLEKMEEKGGDHIAHISYSRGQDLTGMNTMFWAGTLSSLEAGSVVTVDSMYIQTDGVIQWSLNRGMATRSDFNCHMDATVSTTTAAGTEQWSMTMDFKGAAVLKQ
jgi:hypothetical protein